jgi:iron complex outermembrane receptor protein
MSIRRTAILFGTVSTLSLGSFHAGIAQQADQPVAATGQGLEEIVVTARRKEEKLQTVPIAITVVSGAQLEDQRVQTLADLSFQTPSLAFRNVQRDVDGIVNLRGLTGVITYLDEVPLGGVSVPGTGGSPGPGGGAGPGVLYDLDNVQVLKGPQGTLFGRNTTGGAILLQAKKPTNNFEGYVQEQLGNYNDREFEGAVNIPIVEDKLLVRIAGSKETRDGYTYDIGTHQDLDNRDYWAGRIGITWRPTDDFENYLVYDSLYNHTNGTGLVLAAVNPDIIPGATPAPFYVGSFERNFGVRNVEAALAAQRALGPEPSIPISTGWIKPIAGE